jgi:hypothetical protein
MSISTSSVTQARPRRTVATSARSHQFTEHAHDTTGAALAVMACITVVLAAWAMGASWLGSTVLAVPVGIWLAAIGSPIFVLVVKHRHSVVPLERIRAVRELILPRVWPTSGPASLFWDAISDRADWMADFLIERGADGMARRVLSSIPLPTRPVTIGLCLPDALAEAIMSTPSSASRRVDWVRINPALNSADVNSADTNSADTNTDALETGEEPGDPTRPEWFDAVVRYEMGHLIVDCPERAGHDAAWYDWARPRPLTLASVFPFRYDPARITIPMDAFDGMFDNATRTDETRVLRDLIEAAAVLARTPDRLSLGDLIGGRRPLPKVPGAAAVTRRRTTITGGVPGLAESRQHEAEIIRALGESLRRHHGRDTVVLQTAARVVSAWSVHEPGSNALIDDTERIRLASLAAETLTNEPEPDLRLGALHLGTGEDDAAFASLLDAERVLRDLFGAEPDPNAPPAPDQTALVQAYIEHGSDDELMLGRVAAGIVLLAAGTATDRLSFMRDDLIDEFRYAGWLVGRDNDEFVLRKLFREIEHARDAEPVGSIGENELANDATQHDTERAAA